MRRATLALALLAGVAAAGCGPSVRLEGLALEAVEEDFIRLRAELDTRLGGKETENHLIGFEYVVLEGSPEELERQGARELDDPQRRRWGRFVGTKLRTLQDGQAALTDVEGPGPPYRHLVHLPRPAAGPFEKGRRYAIVLRISGRIPTFGYPFVFSRPFETNARAVGVEIPR